MKKPNILLVMCDTFRCDALKCMGNDKAVSPNIDRLASEGVLFNESYSVAPVCGPARSSLVTGVYPFIHQAMENGIIRKNDMPVLSDYLKEAGYYNIMVGVTDFGEKPVSFDVYDDIGHKAFAKLDSYKDFIESKGYSRISCHENMIPKDLFIDSYIAETTIGYIDKALEEEKGPFFAMCSMPSPHAPIDPPDEYKTLFSDNVSSVNYQDGDEKKHPSQLQNILGIDDEENHIVVYGGNDKSVYSKLNEAQGAVYTKELEKEIDEYKRLYYGLCAYCDEQVGKLVEFINNRGLRDNTLIIFTSDHGQQYYDHGFNDKHNFYDASWRVPLVISMPSMIEPRVTSEFATTMDVTATILGAAGITSDTIQGYNLFQLLVDGKPLPRKCATGTLYKHSALVTDRWKLQYFFEDQEVILFDRKNDPMERENLFYKEEYKSIANELLICLLSWNSDINDVHYLKTHVKKKCGPVATRVKKRICGMSGLDAENRLNKKIDNLRQ